MMRPTPLLDGCGIQQSLYDKDMFCPYCGSRDCGEMTDEHVIPLAVGGRPEFVIPVCVECNSRCGHDLDAGLARHTFLRFMSTKLGRLAKRQEKHKSEIILHDGRSLSGLVYWEDTGDGKAALHYEPKPLQTDGSKWLSEHNPNAKMQLPSHVNVLKDDMVDKYSLEFEDPSKLGLEPAMIKILLGTMHLAHGEPITVHDSFNIFRDALVGTLGDRLGTFWVESLEGHVTDPRPNEEHLVWGGCPTGNSFRGGVSLFARFSMIVKVNGFGCVVPNQRARIRTGLPG